MLGLPSVRTALLTPISSFLGPSENSYSHLVTDFVQRKTFQVTVTERGTVDSLNNATLMSKVEGKTSIIWIIPEGTHVKAGDLVCELDASALIDREITQKVNVTQAEAALQTAEREVEIQKTINESNIDSAKLAIVLADLDRRKFMEGDYEQQKMELENSVYLSRENLSRAREFLNYLERLVRKGYKQQSDLDAERIAFTKTEKEGDLWLMKLDVLKKYTLVRTEKELTWKVEESDRQLFRAEKQAEAAMAQKEADLKAKQLSYEVQSSYLARTQEQLKNCKIYAPQDGQVVYVNTRNGRSADQVLVELGAAVSERQAIINLPDLDTMKVNANIHESRISMVRTGLPVIVKIDAAPTETFHGVVDNVSSVPSSGNYFNRDLKEYEAVVRLTDEVSKVNQLRPGLNASVEILVSQREAILQTPIQSLIAVGNKRFAYVLGPNGPQAQEVKIGESNERTVEILEGLNEGDRVVLNPRTHFAKEIGELELQYAKEKPDTPVEIPQASPGGKPAPANNATKSREAGGAPGEGPPNGSPGDSEGRQRRGKNPLARFQSMDQNSDGKLTVDEISERMKPAFDAMDTDHDGAVDQKEFLAAASQFRPRGDAPGGD